MIYPAVLNKKYEHVTNLNPSIYKKAFMHSTKFLVYVFIYTSLSFIEHET